MTAPDQPHTPNELSRMPAQSHGYASPFPQAAPDVHHAAIKRWPATPDARFSRFLEAAARIAGATRIVEIGCEYGRHLAPMKPGTYTGVDYGYFIELANQLRPDQEWIKIDFGRYGSSLFSALHHPDAIYVVRGRVEHVDNLALFLECLMAIGRLGNLVLIAHHGADSDSASDALSPFLRRRIASSALIAALQSGGLAGRVVGDVPNPNPERTRGRRLAVVATGVPSLLESVGEPLGRLLADLRAEGESLLPQGAASESFHAAQLTPESMLFTPQLRLLSTRLAHTPRATQAVTLDSALELIVDAKRTRRPFSLVRLGNGEGRVLGFPDFVPPIWLSRSFRNWFRSRNAELSIRSLQDEATVMIREADLIGVVLEGHHDLQWLLAMSAIDLYGLAGPDAAICGHGLHLDALRRGFFARLMEGEQQVSLVCGHHLGDAFGERFAVPDVRVYKVPAQAKFFDTNEEHYPVVFSRLRDTIEVRAPGEIFLVGAGFLGKLYCGWIKRRGGIALDIGSVFDLWAGEATRTGYAAQVEQYRLLPRAAQ